MQRYNNYFNPASFLMFFCIFYLYLGITKLYLDISRLYLDITKSSESLININSLYLSNQLLRNLTHSKKL